ncbi:LapA family protein [Fundidesulfovibrio butyratiphilus]
MRFVKFTFLVLFFLVFMVFFIQNNGQLSTGLELRFDLFMFAYKSQPIPFYLVLLIFFTLGALFSTVFFVIDRIRVDLTLRKAQNEIGELKSELTSLKASQTPQVLSPPVTPEPAQEG